jgi:hypothetical protein
MNPRIAIREIVNCTNIVPRSSLPSGEKKEASLKTSLIDYRSPE